MTIQFIKPSPERFLRLKTHASETYAREMLRYGEFQGISESQKRAEAEIQEYLPEGQKTMGHYFYELWETEKQQTGYLWFIIQNPQIVDQRLQSHAFLAYIFIDETKRRQQAATLAMDFYEKTVAEKYGASDSSLYVFKENKPAVALYQKRGYQIIHETRFNLAAQNSRFFMKKILMP
ncbi:MAG: GCN5-related N-acetyltransferase [Gammaproteobacteria bacterium]|jgi:ribosomal protein S18 acetylase RimI-like enzyme|nr:GCN5-related N-acetyltransferase [Gammaproteobacteria bacterium]